MPATFTQPQRPANSSVCGSRSLLAFLAVTLLLVLVLSGDWLSLLSSSCATSIALGFGATGGRR